MYICIIEIEKSSGRAKVTIWCVILGFSDKYMISPQ